MTTPETSSDNDQVKSSRPGMGCVLLAALVLLGGSVVLYGYWQIWSTVSGFEDQYLDAGYVLEEGNNVTFEDRIQVATYVYARETLHVEAGSDSSQAITAHEAFIAGHVIGNIAFLGGDLEITEGAVIEGDIDVTMARNVVIRGEVLGEISGTWTRLYEMHGDSSEEPDVQQPNREPAED